MGTTYDPVVAGLISVIGPMSLGPGTPNLAVASQLRALTPAALMAPHAVVDEQMARCCLAGLWLWHGFLDESHQISQQINTPSGSYWHALMHRREGDFGNSKYWFRRVGRHAVFETLLLESQRLAEASDEAVSLRTQGKTRFLFDSQWDPYQLVDLCELAQSQLSSLQPICLAIQRCEYELLFDACYRSASNI